MRMDKPILFAEEMIRREQVHELLVEACPTFSPDLSLEDNLYELLGEFGHHLLELYNRDQSTSFSKIGALTEKLHIEGDDFVKTAATIGFLESLQNIWLNASVDPSPFREFLPPVSRGQWDALNEFWHGESDSKPSSEQGVDLNT